MWMGGGGGNTRVPVSASWHRDCFKQTVKLHQPVCFPSPLPMIVKHRLFPFYPPKELFLYSGGFCGLCHGVATGEAEMGQHVCAWGQVAMYNGEQSMSRVTKCLDEQHCLSSAAIGEETPRDLPPLGQCGGWQ